MEYIPTYIKRLHGKEPVEFKHPRLEPILAETYGIIVYQEQIIRIASDLAGYAPGDADRIRKAVSKKKKKEIDAHRKKFIAGAVKNDIPKKTAEAIYGDIEFFARYGFNKAHAADYALVTCQTAYLKAHYPVEYMTALLTVERGNTEKVGMLVGECRAMDIEVLPPSVNHSAIEFAIQDRPEGPAIRFSLAALKNVGEGPVQQIMDARAEGGPFNDVDDFCTRVDLRRVGRKALEVMIKVGALDEFADRALLLAIVDRLINLSSSTHKASSVGQMSMFDLGGFDAPQLGSVLHPPPDGLAEISQRELLAWEKELAGIYLSSHPIQRFMPQIRAAKTTPLGQLGEELNGQVVMVAGMINSVRPHHTKNGKPMAFVEIEDLQAIREVVVFPRVYEAHKSLLSHGDLIVVRGKVDAPDSRPGKILADTISKELTVYGAVGETTAPYSPPAEPLPPPEPTLPLFDGPPPNFEPAAESPPPTTAKPSNGKTNGAANGSNGAGKSVPAEAIQPEAPALAKPADAASPAPVVVAPGGRLVRLAFTPSGNLPQDKHRMRMAFELLAQHPGKDVFHFNIGNRYTIEFPTQTTHYTEALSQKLEQISGVKILEVTAAD